MFDGNFSIGVSTASLGEAPNASYAGLITVAPATIVAKDTRLPALSRALATGRFFHPEMLAGFCASV